MKVCTKCGESKPTSDFYAYKQTNSSGFHAKCKACVQRHHRGWHHLNHSKHPESRMWAGAKERAKYKGLPFTITRADIVVPEYCPVFGFKLAVQPGARSGGDASPSLDAIIPALGYVPGNIQVISKLAN